MAGKKSNDDFKFEIVEHIGVLSVSEKDWAKEVNKVKWGDNDPVFDIRSWSPDHTKMGKGVTLTEAEYTALKDIISD